MCNTNINQDYKHKALCYAERYGIVEYSIIDNKMIYFESYPIEGKYKCIVNLDIIKETRIHIKN